MGVLDVVFLTKLVYCLLCVLEFLKFGCPEP